MEEDDFRFIKFEVSPPVATVRLKKLKHKGKEMKRRIIVTHKLMMGDVKFLSILHNIRAPNFDLFENLSIHTDSKVFLTTVDGLIDGMTDFFASLPAVLPSRSLSGGSQELNAIENLLELGQRLEALVLRLEYSTFQSL